MIRMFQLLTLLLVLATAFFLIDANYDTAFVTGVLGACAFFLSVRFTYKPRVDERNDERSLDFEQEKTSAENGPAGDQ